MLDQFLLRNCIVFQRRSNFSGHRAAAPARRKGAQQPRESHRGSRSRQPRDPKEPGERGEGGETGSQARGKGKGTRGQLPDSRSRVEARSQSSARRRARARELREPAVKGGQRRGFGAHLGPRARAGGCRFVTPGSLTTCARMGQTTQSSATFCRRRCRRACPQGASL